MEWYEMIIGTICIAFLMLFGFLLFTWKDPEKPDKPERARKEDVQVMKVFLTPDQAVQVRRMLAENLTEKADMVVFIIEDNKLSVRVHNQCAVEEIDNDIFTAV